MTPTWLVVGLGNPEGKYFDTWHNVGFRVAERIAARFDIPFKKSGNQLSARRDNVIILKPLTYMNRSGEAVKAIVRRHNIAPEHIIVITDDLYIDKGNIRIVRGGSHAGHNGIRSINALIGDGTPPPYIKIKVGIKPNPEPHCVANYVLEKIPSNERAQIDESLQMATDAAIQLLDGDTLESAQCNFNTKNEN